MAVRLSLTRSKHALNRRRLAFAIEGLECRRLLNGFSAATAADLITDIGLANTLGGVNTITLTADSSIPYALTTVNNTTDGATGLPVIASGDNLTIEGSSSADTIERSSVNGTPAFRIFDVASGGTLTLQKLTVSNGLASGTGVSAQGGAIYSQGTLTLSGAEVSNNTAKGTDGTVGTPSNSGKAGPGGTGSDAFGGGIYVAAGSLTLDDATIGSNTAQAGLAATAGKGPPVATRVRREMRAAAASTSFKAR